MSYEEDYRVPYKAVCACGSGFLRYYKISQSNDWGQTRESCTETEIMCEACKAKYKFIEGWLVPTELDVPTIEPTLAPKYRLSPDEEFVAKISKCELESILSDLTAPKHRFIRDLTNPQAIQFAENWFARYRKRSLKPMVKYLNSILIRYEDIHCAWQQKQIFILEYQQKKEEYYCRRKNAQEKGFRPQFERDKEQEKLDAENAEKQREEYLITHQYDDFQATVKFHHTFKVDLTGLYWDTLLISECVDPQYLYLEKREYGNAVITIAKKYRCVCTMCRKEYIALSSEFDIEYSDDGYYPRIACDCHRVSSFEAKTMDILNQLGIPYRREASFSDLVGDSGHKLRFDFALYKPGATAAPFFLMLELQGPHHYMSGSYDEYGTFIPDEEEETDDNERLAKQLTYDVRKVDFCKSHGLQLEYIKYTLGNAYDRLEQSVIEILKKYGYPYMERDKNIFGHGMLDEL